MSLTYAAILAPIEGAEELSASIDESQISAAKLCEYCRSIAPDLDDDSTSIYRTKYEREDWFPFFPSLQATATQGCPLCSLLRGAIRKNWAVRPMEESGVGPIRAQDGYWDDLIDTQWDGRVKIHSLTFTRDMDYTFSNGKVEPLPLSVMYVEFSPYLLAGIKEPVQIGNTAHWSIGQIIGFKLYTSDSEISDGRPN